MDVQSKNSIILVEQLQISDWQNKVTSKIEKLAEILIKTGGQSLQPPLVKVCGKIERGFEAYQTIIESDIAIAAKLAETKGLEQLTVLIPAVDFFKKGHDKDITNELVEMASLLNESEAKEAKPEPEVTVTLEPQSEPKATKLYELERTIKLMDTLKKVNYRELQKKLKAYRKEGKTNIKLNRSKANLYLELQRIEGK